MRTTANGKHRIHATKSIVPAGLSQASRSKRIIRIAPAIAAAMNVRFRSLGTLRPVLGSGNTLARKGDKRYVVLQCRDDPLSVIHFSRHAHQDLPFVHEHDNRLCHAGDIGGGRMSRWAMLADHGTVCDGNRRSGGMVRTYPAGTPRRARTARDTRRGGAGAGPGGSAGRRGVGSPSPDVHMMP